MILEEVCVRGYVMALSYSIASKVEVPVFPSQNNNPLYIITGIQKETEEGSVLINYGSVLLYSYTMYVILGNE